MEKIEIKQVHKKSTFFNIKIIDVNLMTQKLNLKKLSKSKFKFICLTCFEIISQTY